MHELIKNNLASFGKITQAQLSILKFGSHEVRHSNCQYRLAMYFLNQAIQNNNESLKIKAAELFKLSAENQISSKDGQVMYGYCLINGIGVEKDIDKGADWIAESTATINYKSHQAKKIIREALAPNTGWAR